MDTKIPQGRKGGENSSTTQPLPTNIIRLYFKLHYQHTTFRLSIMSDKKEYDVSELAAYDSDEDVAVAEAGNKDGDVKK